MSNFWKMMFSVLLALFEQLLEIPADGDHQPTASVGKRLAEKMLENGGNSK